MKRLLVLLTLALAACGPISVTNTPQPPSPIPPSRVPPTAVVTPPTPSGDARFLPNPLLTPGALNPAVTQDTIQSTVCVSGYTSTIRPPVSYTDALKVKQLADPAYGDTADQNTADYEEDHFIPLSIGGNPTDPHNLWPQPRNTTPYNAGVKDQLEFTLYKMVCSGGISLADAQAAISSDWVAAYNTYKVRGLLQAPLLPPEP